MKKLITAILLFMNSYSFGMGLPETLIEFYMEMSFCESIEEKHKSILNPKFFPHIEKDIVSYKKYRKHNNPEVFESFYEKDKQGKTLLHKAVMHKHIDLIKILLDCNVDINSVDKYGNTPLHLALIKEDLDIALLLLNKKPEVLLKNKAGLSASDMITKIECLSSYNIQEIAEYRKNNPYFSIESIDHVTLTEKFFDNNKCKYHDWIIKQKSLQVIFENQWSLLHAASESGNNLLVKYLLDNGADANNTVFGYTPIYFAIAGGHIEIVKLLIAHGALVNINVTQDLSWHHLSRYAYPVKSNTIHSNPNLGTSQIIFDIDLNIKTINFTSCLNNNSPLMTSILNNNLEIIKILINAGAVLNNSDDPLSRAIVLHNPKVFITLCELCPSILNLNIDNFLIRESCFANKIYTVKRLCENNHYKIEDVYIEIIRSILNHYNYDEYATTINILIDYAITRTICEKKLSEIAGETLKSLVHYENFFNNNKFLCQKLKQYISDYDRIMCLKMACRSNNLAVVKFFITDKDLQDVELGLLKYVVKCCNNLYSANLIEFLIQQKATPLHVGLCGHTHLLKCKTENPAINNLMAKYIEQYTKAIRTIQKFYKKTQENKDLCPICQEAILNKPSINLACKHIFHDNCIMQWMEKSNKCPMCRTIMKH